MREWFRKLLGPHSAETRRARLGFYWLFGVVRLRQLFLVNRNHCPYSTSRAYSILSIIPLCLLLFACAATQAEPREAVELKKLVGQKNVDWGSRPGGWELVGATSLAGACTECNRIGLGTHFQNGHYALVVAGATDDWIPTSRVFGVLYLGIITRDDVSMISDSFRCRVNPLSGRKALPHEGRYRIIAEAKFKRDACRRFYSGNDIQRAWHVDFVKGTFTPIETQGLICEDILLGNDPSTKHCPQGR